MKTLVVYYSLDGNTKFIAESIAAAVNADILTLVPKKAVSTSGFGKFFWGGKQVLFKDKPELNSLDKNPEEYDFIFLGSPVWAGTYAPAFNSFFSDIKIQGKNTALFCCYGGSAGKTFENFEKALAGNQVLSSIGFKDPLKGDKDLEVKRAEDWAKGVVSNQ